MSTIQSLDNNYSTIIMDNIIRKRSALYNKNNNSIFLKKIKCSHLNLNKNYDL